jgi:hypothetical protein
MQFALRYPEGADLILLVPAAYPTQIEQGPDAAIPLKSSAPQFLFDAALKLDFLLGPRPGWPRDHEDRDARHSARGHRERQRSARVGSGC